MSIQDALDKLEQARALERRHIVHQPFESLENINRAERRRDEDVLALRMEAVVLAIAAQLEAQAK